MPLFSYICLTINGFVLSCLQTFLFISNKRVVGCAVAIQIDKVKRFTPKLFQISENWLQF